MSAKTRGPTVIAALQADNPTGDNGTEKMCGDDECVRVHLFPIVNQCATALFCVDVGVKPPEWRRREIEDDTFRRVIF